MSGSQFEFAALPGAHNVPYEDFAIRMEEMKRLARSAQDDEHTSSVPVFVVCRRSVDGRSSPASKSGAGHAVVYMFTSSIFSIDIVFVCGLMSQISMFNVQKCIP